MILFCCFYHNSSQHFECIDTFFSPYQIGMPLNLWKFIGVFAGRNFLVVTYHFDEYRFISKLMQFVGLIDFSWINKFLD